MRDVLAAARHGETRRDRAEQPVATVADAEDTDEPAAGQMQTQGPRGQILAPGWFELHVGEQTGLVEGGAGEADAQGLPDWAARAVRADDPASEDRFLGAVVTANNCSRLRLRDTQGNQLGVPFDAPAQFGKQPLGLVLPEPKRERIRCHRLGTPAGQRERCCPPASFVDLDPDGFDPARHRSLGQPEPVEQLQGAHVHDGGPGLLSWPGLAVDDREVHSVLGEQGGQDQTGGTRADDQNSGVHSGHRSSWPLLGPGVGTCSGRANWFS